MNSGDGILGETSLKIDNVAGGVATAVPTPALLPALLGMGAAALRKRKGEAAEPEAMKG
jgi:hypothetical protein